MPFFFLINVHKIAEGRTILKESYNFDENGETPGKPFQIRWLIFIFIVGNELGKLRIKSRNVEMSRGRIAIKIVKFLWKRWTSCKFGRNSPATRIDPWSRSNSGQTFALHLSSARSLRLQRTYTIPQKFRSHLFSIL